MKTTKVNPIHKGGSVLQVSNYRPISLLPIFSKIFERLMYNRLIDFIEKHNILTQNLFGIQKTKQLNLPLPLLFHKSHNSLEKKKNHPTVSS